MGARVALGAAGASRVVRIDPVARRDGPSWAREGPALGAGLGVLGVLTVRRGRASEGEESPGRASPRGAKRKGEAEEPGPRVKEVRSEVKGRGLGSRPRELGHAGRRDSPAH